MKIIKEPVIWKIEKECIANKDNNDGCHAVLEVEAVDIYLSYQQKSQSRDNYYSYTFKCPCCNKENLVEENEIPISIRRAILSIEQANGTKLKYMKELGYK